MSFNDIELKRIKKIVGGFCIDRIPDHQRSQVKLLYEMRGFEVKLSEARPFRGSHVWTERQVARFKYDPDTIRWQLYFRTPPTGGVNTPRPSPPTT